MAPFCYLNYIYNRYIKNCFLSSVTDGKDGHVMKF